MLRSRLTARRRAGAHYTDNFNRADASTLGSDWTNRVSSGNQLVIKGNAASVPTVGGGPLGISSYTAGVMASNNVRVTGVVKSPMTAGEARLLYLNSNTSNQIVAYFYDGLGCFIGTRNGAYSAAYTKRSADGSVACSFVAGDTLSFECSGDVYLAKINGVVIAAWGNYNVTPKYAFADASHREVSIGVDKVALVGGGQDGWDSFDAVDISANSDGSVRAFDISSGGNPDQAWFNAIAAAGYKLFIVDATNTDRSGAATAQTIATTHLGYALNAGLKIAAYGRDPSLWSIGIGACAPYVSQLQFYTLDIEPTLPGATYPNGSTPYTKAKIDSYIAGVTGLGVRPIIYSGNYVWTTGAGGSTDAVTGQPVVATDAQTVYGGVIPLWDSNPNADSGTYKPIFTPSLQVPTWYAFGGWTSRVGVQQSADNQGATFNGILIDTSSFDPSFLTV